MVGDAVRTTWVLAAGYYSVGINAQWSWRYIGIGWSLRCHNVSFVNAFNAVTTVLFEATVTDGSFTASTGLFTTTVAVAVSQFAGHSILLMDWLRIIGDVVRTTWCIGAAVYYSVGINAQWSCR
jgi:hypothetical protein